MIHYQIDQICQGKFQMDSHPDPGTLLVRKNVQVNHAHTGDI